ncbi:MAG: Ldh family oxidoreductase [Alicyclobacillus sp.]|nr:Ldh family oxidoreductase [Alicyclobacillus sp.]
MLQARDVVVCFGPREQEHIVLRGLNLIVESGQSVGIEGAPKSGKTTLAAVLAGVMPKVYGEVNAGGAKRGLVSAAAWNSGLRSNCQGSIYTQLAEAKSENPDLLIIDDAEAFATDELRALVKERASSGHTTILLSSDPFLLNDLADLVFLLEHGRLVARPTVQKQAAATVEAPNVVTFSVNELTKRIMTTLCSVGISDSVAERVTKVLVDAEVRGHSSHGVGLLPTYLKRVAHGGIDGQAEPQWETKFGSVGILDARGGFGQLAALEAAEWCAKQAAENGIAAAAIRNNNHVGMLAAYRWPFQQRNVVGLLLNISGPSVSAPGATKATLGSNTFCLIAPTAKDEPFVVDLGTGVVAAGKIRTALVQGKSVPSEWLQDKNGKPSTNPADLDAGGSIPVFGGYKGLGVTIIAEVLAGMLGGKTVSPLVNKQRKYFDKPMNCSQLFIGLSVQAFGLVNLDDLIKTLHNAVVDGYPVPPQPPYFPNQAEMMSTKQAFTSGISIAYKVAEELQWI